MESPKWNTGDSIRSVRDVGKMFLEWLERKDTELADAINTEEDAA